MITLNDETLENLKIIELNNTFAISSIDRKLQKKRISISRFLSINCVYQLKKIEVKMSKIDREHQSTKIVVKSLDRVFSQIFRDLYSLLNFEITRNQSKNILENRIIFVHINLRWIEIFYDLNIVRRDTLIFKNELHKSIFDSMIRHAMNRRQRDWLREI